MVCFFHLPATLADRGRLTATPLAPTVASAVGNEIATPPGPTKACALGLDSAVELSPMEGKKKFFKISFVHLVHHKDFFRTCNVLPFSCTHLALWRGKKAR